MRRIDWVLNGSLQRGHAGPFALALILSRHPLQKLWPRSSSVDQMGTREFLKMLTAGDGVREKCWAVGV